MQSLSGWGYLWPPLEFAFDSDGMLPFWRFLAFWVTKVTTPQNAKLASKWPGLRAHRNLPASGATEHLETVKSTTSQVEVQKLVEVLDLHREQVGQLTSCMKTGMKQLTDLTRKRKLAKDKLAKGEDKKKEE